MDNENNLLNEETKNTTEALDTKQSQLLTNKTNVLKDFDEGLIKYDFLLNIKRPPDTKHPLPEQYLSNAICTSKYTSLNAFPKIAFEQFSQIGNLYFLFLAVLQMLPFISQSGGSPTMLIPLLFVTGLNGFKDYFEDRKRKISDNKENSSNAIVYRPEGATKVQWKDLTPGDIIPSRVTHFESFGAFLDVGCGVCSLMSIDSVSVSRISNPKDRFSIREELMVVVKSIDYEEKRLYVSTKELFGTWEENADMYKAGQTVSGIVRSIESYGIFVELAPNLAGLAELKDGVKVGQSCAVYIKSILPEKMKIKLVIIDTYDEEIRKRAEESYFIDTKSVSHIDYWKYSPDCCNKVIETVF